MTDLLPRWRLGGGLTLMARKAGDPAEDRLARLGLMVGIELPVDGPGHLEHPARDDFLWIVVACEVAADVTGVTAAADGLHDVVHFLLKIRREQAREDLDARAVDHGWRWRLRTK